ncbi:MAG: PEP-CTERM sorting domain-containing protein [Alphaproteobacteria bacterium]
MPIIRSKSKFLRSLLAGAALAAAMFASTPSSEAGYLVVNNDEWTFSNTGFAQSPDASVFINNITNLFTGDQPGNFLAYSQNFSLTGASLANAVTGAGHTWAVSTAGPFTSAALGAYDAVFFAGTIGGLYPDQQVIIDYLQAGGNVYIGAGTGNGGAAVEAAAWNQVLATAGLEFQGSYNFQSGNIAPIGPHPLLAGVSSLYFNHGNSVSDLDLAGTNGEILFETNGHGMLALGSFGTLPPPSEFSPIAEPGTLAVLGLGLIGLGIARRRYGR